MSSVCPNCGTAIGCGCQRRTSISGKACCKQCVAAENTKTIQAKPSPQVTQTIVPPNK